jgi:hypothetical protein
LGDVELVAPERHWPGNHSVRRNIHKYYIAYKLALTLTFAGDRVDFYQSGQKQLVWRGQATKTLNQSKDPQQNQDCLNKAAPLEASGQESQNEVTMRIASGLVFFIRKCWQL